MQKVILSIFCPALVAIVIRIIFALIGFVFAGLGYCYELGDAQIKSSIRDFVEFDMFKSDTAGFYWIIVLVIVFLMEMAIWEERKKQKNSYCIYDKILFYIIRAIAIFVIGGIVFLLGGWIVSLLYDFTLGKIFTITPIGIDKTCREFITFTITSMILNFIVINAQKLPIAKTARGIILFYAIPILFCILPFIIENKYAIESISAISFYLCSILNGYVAYHAILPYINKNYNITI